MAQDIRELFKNDKGISGDALKSGHERRFEARLDAHFGTAKKSGGSYLWLKIAAVLIVVIAVGGLLINNPLTQNGGEGNQVVITTDNKTAEPQVQLSDLSPQFKKVEDYYLASINVELAQLQINEDNKALVDSFMTQLDELNQEYKRLNADLVEVGVNEQTVSALIDNLKLRLDLLFKLKEKLTELKETRNSEVQSNTI